MRPNGKLARNERCVSGHVPNPYKLLGWSGVGNKIKKRNKFRAGRWNFSPLASRPSSPEIKIYAARGGWGDGAISDELLGRDGRRPFP